jgi:hypothetical protein
MDKCQFLINELVERTLETSSVLQKNKEKVLAEIADFIITPVKNTKILEQSFLDTVARLSAKPNSTEFDQQLYNMRMAKLFCSINQIYKSQL